MGANIYSKKRNFNDVTRQRDKRWLINGISAIIAIYFKLWELFLCLICSITTSNLQFVTVYIDILMILNEIIKIMYICRSTHCNSSHPNYRRSRFCGRIFVIRLHIWCRSHTWTDPGYTQLQGNSFRLHLTCSQYIRRTSSTWGYRHSPHIGSHLIGTCDTLK